MDGLLIIDKPAGITSHDVVDRVRRILKTRRVGHTGTLDPFATGVMVVLVGKATRLAQFLDKDDKEYEAVVRFGYETDTGDNTGAEKGKSLKVPSVDDLVGILPAFVGKIEQVPPMYSAKKIAGKKLYEHARKGVEVERQPVTVTISKLQFLDTVSATDMRIRVACSAGTYVRTLAGDIGRRLGSAAHLAELRRTRSGGFNLAQSNTLDDLADTAEPASRVLPIDQAVAHLPGFTIDESRVAATKNGLATTLDHAEFADRQPLRILDAAGTLLAVGFYQEVERSVRPKVVLG
jgi:tRNA pseudouridine55 synthase